MKIELLRYFKDKRYNVYDSITIFHIRAFRKELKLYYELKLKRLKLDCYKIINVNFKHGINYTLIKF